MAILERKSMENDKRDQERVEWFTEGHLRVDWLREAYRRVAQRSSEQSSSQKSNSR